MTTTIWAHERTVEYTIGDTVFSPDVYRCHLAIIAEEDGTYSAIVLNLPGAGSCGDSEREAIDNAREGTAGVIASYLEDEIEVPWGVDYDIPEGAKTKWILVHA